MSVDRAALQGGILCGYAYPRAVHLLCEVRDPAAARAWLGGIIPRVTSALPWDAKPASTLNLAFSVPGLERLGVPGEVLAAFPPEVREGMAARAQALGDRGADAPGTWEPGLDDRVAHVVATVHVLADDDAAEAAAVEAVLPGEGVAVLARERCRVLPEGREHFGFRDGLAQPSIADDHAGPWHGTGTPPRRRRRDASATWEPLSPGEFVLGHPDEDGDLPEAPPAPFDTGTTFLVLRKLAQDVGAWRRWLLERSGGDAAAAERLAAHLVGRWPNGTPVARSPDAPDPELDELWVSSQDLTAAQRERRFALLNDFRFGGRGDGRCARAAHVRRANPRDGLGDGRRAARHRMIRRGMPYGPAAPPGPDADDAPRGLWFASYQASVARQFELVQRDWLNDGDAFGLGRDRCPIAASGDPEGKVVVPGRGARVMGPPPAAVRLRGGGYFVVPSIPALRTLT